MTCPVFLEIGVNHSRLILADRAPLAGVLHTKALVMSDRIG